jgi:hypothetical protein
VTFSGMCVPMHVLSVRSGRPDRLRSKLGEILFWRERVGASVISHEALHAALATLRMAGLEGQLSFGYDGGDREVDGEMQNEERLCYMLGAIQRQIVSGLYERGVY